MRAVVFDLSLPRYALAKGLGRWAPSLYLGRPSCLSLREVAEPSLPSPEWVKVRPRYAGICGSDLAAIFLKMSPVLTPFSSTPSVLGHEVMGDVVEAGAASGAREGDRVAVDPFVTCAVRGRPACAACGAGRYAGCLRVGEDDGLSPGMFVGFHKELGGGWADALVVHRSQLVSLPPALDDRAAALLEPLSVALHAVGKRPLRDDEHALVIGGGPIALLVVAALRLMERRCRVTVSTLLPFQAELARRLGATEAVAFPPAESTRRLAELAGARPHKPLVGAEVYSGGFDVVFDCIGSRASVDQALRLARAGGAIVLVGAAGLMPMLDWTFVWSKELSILGALAYDQDLDLAGVRRRTFDLAAERASSTALPLGELVTHVVPLGDYREAILANVERGRSKAFKTLLDPRR